MSLTSGTKLGRYEIVSQIGKGGMGEVWRAQIGLNPEVTITLFSNEEEWEG